MLITDQTIQQPTISQHLKRCHRCNSRGHQQLKINTAKQVILEVYSEAMFNICTLINVFSFPKHNYLKILSSGKKFITCDSTANTCPCLSNKSSFPRFAKQTAFSLCLKTVIQITRTTIFLPNVIVFNGTALGCRLVFKCLVLQQLHLN